MAAGSKYFELEGFEKFKRQLKTVPDRMKRTEMLKILRRQLSDTRREARKEFTGKGTGKGEGARAIGFKTGGTRENPAVYLGVQNKNRKASHWALRAFGTKERKTAGPRTDQKKVITTKDGRQGIRVRMKDGRIRFVESTGIMPAHPYMDIAVRRTGLRMSKAATDRMLKYLEQKTSQALR